MQIKAVNPKRDGSRHFFFYCLPSPLSGCFSLRLLQLSGLLRLSLIKPTRISYPRNLTRGKSTPKSRKPAIRVQGHEGRQPYIAYNPQKLYSPLRVSLQSTFRRGWKHKAPKRVQEKRTKCCKKWYGGGGDGGEGVTTL